MQLIPGIGRHRNNHRRHQHQGNNVLVPTPVRVSSEWECGLLPEHDFHWMNRRCNHWHLAYFSLFRLTPASLCWWHQNIIIIIPTFSFQFSFHRNSWHLALPGGGTDTRGRKTDGQHHRWREGDHLPVPAAVHGTTARSLPASLLQFGIFTFFLMSSCLLGLSQQANNNNNNNNNNKVFI